MGSNIKKIQTMNQIIENPKLIQQILIFTGEKEMRRFRKAVELGKPSAAVVDILL